MKNEYETHKLFTGIGFIKRENGGGGVVCLTSFRQMFS